MIGCFHNEYSYLKGMSTITLSLERHDYKEVWEGWLRGGGGGGGD